MKKPHLTIVTCARSPIPTVVPFRERFKLDHPALERFLPLRLDELDHPYLLFLLLRERGLRTGRSRSCTRVVLSDAGPGTGPDQGRARRGGEPSEGRSDRCRGRLRDRSCRSSSRTPRRARGGSGIRQCGRGWSRACCDGGGRGCALDGRIGPRSGALSRSSGRWQHWQRRRIQRDVEPDSL